MTAVMTGKILFSRTAALMNGKLQYANRVLLLQPNAVVPFSRPTSDAKSLLDTYKIPQKPKKPLTAYFRYLIEKRPGLSKENPSLKNIDLVKLISEQWRSLSPEAKQKYEEESLHDKKKYEIEIESYNSKLTSEQQEVLHQIERTKRRDRKHRRVKKESKAEGKPKRPLNSYALFIRDHISSGKSIKELMSELKDKWVQLSEVEKEKYQIEYHRNWEKYETDLTKWENDRLAEGKSHLVRSKTLKNPDALDLKEKPEKSKNE